MIQPIVKIAIVTALLAACSSKPKDVANATRGDDPAVRTQASMEAKQLAAEQNSQYVTEINFRKGSTELTPASRRKLEALLKSVANEKEVDEIKVISWADEAYPSKEVRELSKEQKELAEERNEEIKSFLKTKDKRIPIAVHNMAERPSTLNNLWGSSDARIKKSLESSGLTHEGMEAKTSHSIVMIELK